VVNVLLAVRQVLTDGPLVGVEHARLWRLASLNGHRPRTVLDASSDVVGTGIRVGSGEIHVQSTCRAVEGVVRVHACDLAGVGVHASCCLTRLDVTPNYTKSVPLTYQCRIITLAHGCHVSLVVHEASIKVGCVVG
jgi:RecJ-like exonuclease